MGALSNPMNVKLAVKRMKATRENWNVTIEFFQELSFCVSFL